MHLPNSVVHDTNCGMRAQAEDGRHQSLPVVFYLLYGASLLAQMVKNLPATPETQV